MFTQEEVSSGFRCGSYAEGDTLDMNSSNAYVEGRFPKNQWIHLVGVSDGETNKYYLNGELMETIDRKFGGATMNLLMAPASLSNQTMVHLYLEVCQDWSLTIKTLAQRIPRVMRRLHPLVSAEEL